MRQARDQFSDAVNRAAFGGEITYGTRGRMHSRAAAIVPANLVEAYEALIDQEDGAIAARRLADIDAGRSQVVSADELVADPPPAGCRRLVGYDNLWPIRIGD